MSRLRPILLLALFAAFVAPNLLQAAGTLGLTETDRAFFLELKKAVLNRDASWLAERLALPMRVQTDLGRLTLSTPQDFVENYDQAMTTTVLQAVRRQTSDTLVKNAQGVMIGDGEIWFAEIAEDDAHPPRTRYWITAINP